MGFKYKNKFWWVYWQVKKDHDLNLRIVPNSLGNTKPETNVEIGVDDKEVEVLMSMIKRK